MRLRVFEAATAQEALEAVRRVLGPDAAILATTRVGDRVRVTAAVDLDATPAEDILAGAGSERVASEVDACLAAHRVLPDQLGRLVEEAAGSGLAESEAALAHALAALGGFARPDVLHGGSLAVVGPPGAGKTTLIVRLAAAARLAGREVRVAVDGDLQAGARERLAALLRPLGLQASDGKDRDGDGPLLVDTVGTNPFDARELAAVLERVRGRGCTPILVLPACTDAAEAFDAGCNFAALGVRRAVVTGLDRTRRLGSLVSLLAAGLVLCGATASPFLDRGVLPLTPAGLARMLLRRKDRTRERPA
ncbi:hypothetical protein HRbin39_00226 [bacterium HR39]|nr:hypothetical protein HRbin39_00226 [bacterium HR39]